MGRNQPPDEFSKPSGDPSGEKGSGQKERAGDDSSGQRIYMNKLRGSKGSLSGLLLLLQAMADRKGPPHSNEDTTERVVVADPKQLTNHGVRDDDDGDGDGDDGPFNGRQG